MAMNSWLNSIADAGRELWSKASQRNEKSIKDLCQQLSSNKGEAMGTALAYAVVKAYQELDEVGKADFFELFDLPEIKATNPIIGGSERSPLPIAASAMAMIAIMIITVNITDRIEQVPDRFRHRCVEGCRRQGRRWGCHL